MPGVLHVYANAGFGRGGNLDILLKPGARARHERRDVGAGAAAPGGRPRLRGGAHLRADRRAFAGCARRAPATRSRSTSSATTSVSSSSSAASSRSGCAVFPASRTSTCRRTRAVRSSPSCSTASARARSNLDVATVGQTVRTALDGTIATKYTQGNFEYDVRVLFPRNKFTSASELGEVMLFPGGRGTAPVFLRDVADVGRPSDRRTSTARTRTACCGCRATCYPKSRRSARSWTRSALDLRRSRCRTATASSSAATARPCSRATRR